MEMFVVNLGDMFYDGTHLHHALAYEHSRVLGPSICYGIGPAEVKEHLVDLEDSLDDDFIRSEKMAHFIIEIPGADIRETVVWQRLFIRQIAKRIQDNLSDPGPSYLSFDIHGDDIMIENQKLSVSISTLSRFSGLIHVGINIHVGDGCPVSAIGLADLGALNNYTNESDWAERVSRMFADEFQDIVNATYKVIEVN